jgi:putative DNA methylase
MPRKSGPSKKETLQMEITRAVGAGKEVSMDTVDFSDPNRPKTCLEVDFPILPVNQVAVIEGNAGKPIYQMSKWWARRRSSVFRSMLIAAATKAPDDPSHAAKLVWDNYYANHQRLGAFKNLKVADIFMGGGTTLVEGSRLGMQMFGNDLNPVAWFVVKQELAKVDIEEVKRLLADIEAEVKPQIMPYYCCDGPNGEKGKWTHKPTGRVEGPDFDPLSIPRDQRKDYRYEGPEIIYTFWAKHGPCQVTGCGHRTPIMSSPVMAIKTLTVKSWDFACPQCGKNFDLEDAEARIAPDSPLYVVPGQKSYATLQPNDSFKCPHCGSKSPVNRAYLGKGGSKKIELSLLVHPQWLAGCPGTDEEGRLYGGSAQDDAESTARWNAARAKNIRLLEVRGSLPDEVEDPETGIRFAPEKGTVPRKSHYACGACGTVQDVLGSIKPTGKTGAMAGYAIQGYAPRLAEQNSAYNGRFFSPFNETMARQYDAAFSEWSERSIADLEYYWPQSEVPYGFMTGIANGDIRTGHGFTHWWTMFNPRQLLAHSQLLKAIANVGQYTWDIREFVLGAFQNYTRNQNMFAFWHLKKDHFAPALSNDNFHPKTTLTEVGVFSPTGYGPWSSTVRPLFEANNWAKDPWEIVSVETLKRTRPDLAQQTTAKGEKVSPHDATMDAAVVQGSSTDLAHIATGSYDLVITDPPFGGLLHYSELSDFFYVWLRLALKDQYPDSFGPEYSPKSLEVVANRAREPEDSDGFYQRLLSQCWREANRILKPAGLLAFTFHHSEDKPWVAVLESLFDAGFYLEATYPIRSDETKGEGEFGSKTIEYDIIHVCRKRSEEPTPVSWGRMRREVLADVRNLQAMLENHAKAGLPVADLQVIRRGKALEYYSRHYGKVYVDQDRIMDVREALVGINQLIDESGARTRDPPPANAEPMTRQFLRIFDGVAEVPRDQMQKFLKGSGLAPDEFVERLWCEEKDKVFHLVEPLAYAQRWKGEKRSKLSADLDQALFLVGACCENSGINAGDTLRNGNFKPHVALKGLLEYLSRHLPDSSSQNAASRAHTILKAWMDSNRPQRGQMDLFEEDEA